MKKNKKNNLKIKAFNFIKAFFLAFPILLIGSKLFGLTPKQLDPVPWNELFSISNLLRIFIISLGLSVFSAIFKDKLDNNQTKK